MSTIAYFCLLSLFGTVVRTTFVCPGYGYWAYELAKKPCTDQCSAQNDTCGTGKKCCYSPVSPCGFRCMIPKDNTPKAGSCPSRNSMMAMIRNPAWGVCDDHQCDVDKDCRCRSKCCANKCGSLICIDAE
jgi:hypothetical protein